MKTCGAALTELLEANGIDHVFGIPSVHTIELYRGLPGSGIRHVTPRHEQGAGFMADGFARASGRPAACFIITGPGMTNISTAMGQACGDSVPMVVASSVNQRHELGLGQGRLHELSDQSGAIRHVSAFSHTLLRPDDLPAVVEHAFATLRAARPRPVHIEIPIDVLDLPAADIEAAPAASPSSPAPDPAAIAAAARMLAAAERPALLLGGGALAAGDDARRLAEVLGAPTTLTSNAKGLLPPDHPLLLGSYIMSPEITACVDASDVVLAVGTELGETDYGYDALPGFVDQSVPLVRIDIDPEQTTRNARPALAVTADAGAAIAALLERLAGHAPWDGAARVRHALRVDPLRSLEPRLQRHHRVFDALRSALPDAVIVGDSTEPVYFGQTHFNAARPRSWFCSSTGYGTLGYALPAAIGAKLARPEAPVVALTGDGGLMYCLGEMASAAGANTPIICLLWNNRSFAEIRHCMVAAQVEPTGVELYSPDFLRLSESMGWSAAHAETAGRAARVAARRREAVHADPHRDHPAYLRRGRIEDGAAGGLVSIEAIVTTKRAPPPAAASQRASPRWRRAIWRTRYRPRPTPSPFSRMPEGR